MSANKKHDRYPRRKRKLSETVVTQIYVIHDPLTTVICFVASVVSALNVLGNLRFRLHLTVLLTLILVT